MRSADDLQAAHPEVREIGLRACADAQSPWRKDIIDWTVSGSPRYAWTNRLSSQAKGHPLMSISSHACMERAVDRSTLVS